MSAYEYHQITRRIRQLREDAGHSQEGMARIAGMAQGTLSEWERNPPRQLAWLARLAKHYDVNPGYLLGLTDDPTAADGRPMPEGADQLLAIVRALSPAGVVLLARIAAGILDHERDLAAGMVQTDMTAAMLDMMEDESVWEQLEGIARLSRRDSAAAEEALVALFAAYEEAERTLKDA